MNYITLSGAVDTDPFFDPRSMRPSYQDEHEIPVDMEDHEPVPGCAVTVSYRAFVIYSDSGTRRLVRVELLKHQTMEELRRGRLRPSYALNPYAPSEAGLISVLMVDAAGKRASAAIEDEVQRHQADRDEELADRLEAAE